MTRLADQLQRMLSVHRTEFGVAQPPVALPPGPVDVAALEKNAIKEAKSGLSVLKISARREASDRARRAAREEAARETARREEDRLHRQLELDGAWQSLLSNDPETVIAALEGAFADNDAPAVPVDCADGRVTVLMVMEPEEAFPERIPKVTPTGKPSSRKLSKTERSELYVAWMSSNILATVREALATAPSIHAVTVGVMRKGSPTPFGEIPLGVVYAGTFTREMCDRIAWERPEALDAILYADDLLMVTVGRTKGLAEIDLANHPDLQAVVEEVRQAFQESPDAFQTATTFDVTLATPGAKPIQMIKIVRDLTGLGLKEAKDLVDAAPTRVLAGVGRHEAEAACEALLQVGAGAQAEVSPSQ